MIQYGPFEQEHRNITNAWNRVYEAVNRTSPNLNALGPTAIKKYIKQARQDINNKDLAEVRTTGCNDSETELENRARSLVALVILT